MNILKELSRPYKIDDELIRLGYKSDGGYILNKKSIESIDLCYTYGVGAEISFENDLSKFNPNVKIHLYDHTVDSPELLPNMVFHKEGLHGYKDGLLDSFFNHFETNQDDYGKQILLKLDAEGAEYSLFENYNVDRFKHLHAMVIEFHDLHINLEKYLKIIYHLNKYFKIVHIHANNCGSVIDFQNFIFPMVPEITFVNSLIYNCQERIFKKYPIEGLDYKNEIKRPNFEIDFVN